MGKMAKVMTVRDLAELEKLLERFHQLAERAEVFNKERIQGVTLDVKKARAMAEMFGEEA